MAFCASCGTQMADNAAFCPNCGKAAGQASGAGASPAPAPAPPAGYAAPAASSPIAENVAGMLAYFTIIPAIIFLLVEPYNRNRFVRFHSFQCLFTCAALIVLHVGLLVRSYALPLIMFPILGAAGTRPNCAVGAARHQGLSAHPVQAAHRGRHCGETGRGLNILCFDHAGPMAPRLLVLRPLTLIIGGRLLPTSARLPFQNVISTYSFFPQSDILSSLLQTQNPT